MTPEFSRPERLDAIGERERVVHVIADAGERAALAERFEVVAIDRLQAEFAIRREAGGVLVAGRVTGQVTQVCSVTGEPLNTAIDEPVALRFVDGLESGEDELELSDEALDTLPIEGGAVDLGEIAAETLALALDLFPRGAGAEAALAEAGVLSEGEAGPFGALAALRDKLNG